MNLKILLASVSVALGGSAVAAQAADTIKSGAGPGWPRTLSRSDFVRHVDNKWFPLAVGSKWHYRGLEGHTHMVDKVRVTPKTKKIEGVKTTVVHDVVSKHGRPVEITRDFYAQDHRGNVWYFGEATREVDRHGNTTSTEGSFLAGKNGARPGLFMPGHPKVGMTARQEYLKGHAADHFKVLDLDAHVSVPFVTSHHALRTKEWTPLEPGVIDNKYYVAGIGSVREITVKGGVERLHLISFKHNGRTG
jgi:hypothetical protein